MEVQIQQAVEIASSPSSDAALKEQALAFITEIKSSNDGWQPCLKLLQLDDTTTNTKFFALQVINERLPFLPDGEKVTLKDMIFNYLKSLVSSNKIEPFFLRNALSKTLGLIFVHCTLSCYAGLIKDLLSLSYNASTNSFNDIATDYLTRTLLVIHQEIGDQLVTRNSESQDHNNALKDAIRVTDMVSLAEIWKKILSNYTNIENISNKQLADEIVNNTISCIGSYVSWIEINLILDEQYMSFFYQFLSSSDNSKRRVITANTFNDILHKKMTPVKKLELLNFLSLGPILNQMNIKSNIMEFDVAMSLAKLVNQIGDETILLLDNSAKEELMNSEFRNLASSKILEVFPLIFEFLQNEYDDISIEVFPFIANFLLFLKKNITNEEIDFSSLNNVELLTTLAKNIILKMKFDQDDDGDDDDTIEQFNEIRTKLKVFLDSIVLLNETLALDVLMNCINEFLFSAVDSGNKAEVDWRTIELGLYVLTYYSDMLRNNIMNLPKTMINNSRPYFVFNEMLCKVIEKSEQILISHPLIQLLFFELLSKHYTFFTNGNNQVEGVNKDDILMKVLNIFVSNFGVFSSNEKVQYRSWYLFYRFIKMTKPRISDFIIQELIKSLLPLLNFNIEITSNKNKSASTSPIDALKDIDLTLLEETGSFENQLYLFESVGILITLISNDDNKINVFESVLQPMFSNLESGISSVTNSQLNLITLIQVHHSLVAMGNIIKGLESLRSETLVNTKFLNLFNQISQVIFITLDNFVDFNIIRECIQFCVVRMFITLHNENESNKELLQTILSKFISCIMINFDKLKSVEIINFVNFVSQILHQTSDNQSSYALMSSLLAPFLNKAFYRIESDQSKVTDDFSKKEVLDLERSILSMIVAVSNDHLNSMWLASTENIDTLINVIKLMLNYASNYSSTDLSVVKLAILVLNMLCQGVGSGIVIDPLDNFKNNENKFEQADEILINNCVLLGIELGLKTPAGNKQLLKDAQFRNNVTLETCRLMKGIAHLGFEYPDANTLQKKKADVMNNNSTNMNNKQVMPLPAGFNEMKCQQITSVLVNNFGFPGDLATDLVQNLVASTDRQFMKYLVALVEKF